MEAVADGFVHKLRRNSGVDASRDRANNLSLGTYNVADTINFGADERVHRPVLFGFAELDREIFEDVLALGRVSHLRVKLDSVQRLLRVRDTGKRSVAGGSNGKESRRKITQFVAVGHPHVNRVRDAGEEDIDMRSGIGVAGNSQDGVAVLLAVASRNVLSMVPGNLLETVTNSENGDLRMSNPMTHGRARTTNIEVEHGGIYVRGIRVVDRVRRPGENDALWVEGQFGNLLSAGQHFGIHIVLT
jgi:hypothetical protein